MRPRRGTTGPATSPAVLDSTEDHRGGDHPNPNGWLRHREVYAAVPVSVAQMKCSLCVHAFVLLDLPENREVGLSINKVATNTGADWHLADWHLRNHLGAAGWVLVTDSTGRGSPARVRVIHNPAVCRGLVSRHARPLTTVEKRKPPARKAPKFGTPPEQARNPARTEFGIPPEELRNPTRTSSVGPCICDLSPPLGPPSAAPPPTTPARHTPGQPRDHDHEALRTNKSGDPTRDEPPGEERASGSERPSALKHRNAEAVLQ